LVIRYELYKFRACSHFVGCLYCGLLAVLWLDIRVCHCGIALHS